MQARTCMICRLAVHKVTFPEFLTPQHRCWLLRALASTFGTTHQNFVGGGFRFRKHTHRHYSASRTARIFKLDGELVLVCNYAHGHSQLGLRGPRIAGKQVFLTLQRGPAQACFWTSNITAVARQSAWKWFRRLAMHRWLLELAVRVSNSSQQLRAYVQPRTWHTTER